MTCTNVPKSRIRSLTVLSILGVLACGNEDPDGTVTVRYSLGVANMCETLGVQTVRVDIGDGTETAEDDCDPNSAIVMDSVKAGNYPLLVTGIDSMGITVMDNIDQPTEDDTVEVVGGSSREVEASLAATPAKIGVKLNKFLNGDPAECSFLTTASFQVTAYQNGGTSVLLSETFECTQPPGFAPMIDENRDLDGQDLDAIAVRLLDDGGDELTEVTFEFDPPGPGRVVELTLNCDEVAGAVTCEGTSNVSGGTDTTEPTTGPEPTGGPESTGGDSSG